MYTNVRDWYFLHLQKFYEIKKLISIFIHTKNIYWIEFY